ncbi:hypothetical protein B0H11DRAFT_1917726 [Mycena galericulata]|nr:hypothetical protein B0H11DRAFT_1917726 [Mycena galericulata]
MSTYTSEIPLRVQMACSNCRQRKVKCITPSEKTVCLRCQHNGLLCEYVATERQARSKDSAPFEHSTSESGNTGAAQATSSHNHGPSPTYAVASVREDLVTVEGIARELVRKDTYDVKFSHACGKIFSSSMVYQIHYVSEVTCMTVAKVTSGVEVAEENESLPH